MLPCPNEKLLQLLKLTQIVDILGIEDLDVDKDSMALTPTRWPLAHQCGVRLLLSCPKGDSDSVWDDAAAFCFPIMCRAFISFGLRSYISKNSDQLAPMSPSSAPPILSEILLSGDSPRETSSPSLSPLSRRVDEQTTIGQCDVGFQTPQETRLRYAVLSIILPFHHHPS
jgi:hypothetical protein